MYHSGYETGPNGREPSVDLNRVTRPKIKKREDPFAKFLSGERDDPFREILKGIIQDRFGEKLKDRCFLNKIISIC